MPKRLLDRQVSLLAYLTSSVAIFGDKQDACLPQPLRGIDRRLLRLEARLSHEKRMEKIAAVFPRTFQILGTKLDPIVRRFVAACPPADISRLANARQFHDFLSTYWQRKRPDPAYLRDVAACELACAEVRVEVEEGGSREAISKGIAPRWRIRRHPGVILLRCSHDIRSIFEEDLEGSEPPARDTPIAIAMPPGGDQPRVSELPPSIFDLLAALDAWIDPTDLGLGSDLGRVVDELTEHGLLEVRG